jgi:hypothetical protein
MKGRIIARALLGLAVLTLIGVTALAEDNSKSTITINGGRQTVFMKAPSHVNTAKTPCTKGKFYDNICGGSIDTGEGYTISDGSPIDTEYTPAGQIKVLKAGTTSKVGVTVGFVEGTNGAIVDVDKSCKNLPCGNPDGSKHICQGKITNRFTFGDAYTVETIKCKIKVKKGELLWVYNQAEANSWLAWDISAALGGGVEGTNDVWGTYDSSENVGGLAIY